MRCTLDAIRRGHGDVGPEDQERADAALRSHRVEELVGALSLARQVVGVDVPDPRDLRPVLGVLDEAVAGELVRLLPVLASPLPVALPGDAAVSAERLADLAQRQHQVDERQHRVGALRLLLGASARQHHAPLDVCEHAHGAHLLLDGHAGHPLGHRRIVRQHRPAHLVEPLGPLRDVRLVDQAVPDRDVKQRVGEREIRPRRELQVKRGGARGLRGARVDDDELPAAVALRVESTA